PHPGRPSRTTRSGWARALCRRPQAATLEAKMHEHEQPGLQGGQHHAQPQPDEQPPDPTMGGHGMLVFGENVLYMSHLPMFMRPHNFQVLLEVDFDEDVRRLLVDDREATGGGMYTWDPREFTIAELRPAGHGPASEPWVGNLVRGHFERGGQPRSAERRGG